jgi:predicted secreted protein
LLADPKFWKRRGESIASEEDFMRRYTRQQQSSRNQDIAEALIASGYKALDAQAKALGIHRATAWTIIKNKHKLGRLSAKTIQRILSNSETPQAVREVIRKYMAERSTADQRADTRKQ